MGKINGASRGQRGASRPRLSSPGIKGGLVGGLAGEVKEPGATWSGKEGRSRPFLSLCRMQSKRAIAYF
ncbi:hypothetical protein MBAV_005596 [Candidatus Magnetobacterium bavaricum]|uniref:Uncharacterized protein n=1 Tax=Candidatus Magnetobacterium bavaricum TaxID=29290 RepID=A0A0F3GJY7_9BACT|nr:hypothetical protein MBAV_005596 [Candidatus Magnetobacterium bavaricum]